VIVYCVTERHDEKSEDHRVFYRNKRDAVKAAREIIREDDEGWMQFADDWLVWQTSPSGLQPYENSGMWGRLARVRVTRHTLATDKDGIVFALNDAWSSEDEIIDVEPGGHDKAWSRIREFEGDD